MVFVALFSLLVLLTGRAHAFLWFGDGDAAKSKHGIDLKQGYDVNTVITVTGRVARIPHADDKKNMLLEMVSGSETIHVSIGTEASWGKNALAISLNDELTVKGSKAQGSDGEIYILAQRLIDRSAGGQLMIRDEQGSLAKSPGNVDFSVPRQQIPGGIPRGGPPRGGGMIRR